MLEKMRKTQAATVQHVGELAHAILVRVGWSQCCLHQNQVQPTPSQPESLQMEHKHSWQLQSFMDQVPAFQILIIVVQNFRTCRPKISSNLNSKQHSLERLKAFFSCRRRSNQQMSPCKSGERLFRAALVWEKQSVLLALSIEVFVVICVLFNENNFSFVSSVYYL